MESGPGVRATGPSWPGAMTAGAILEGKYRIERVIGSGGMGIVFEATHLHLGERVAIKFPRPEALGRAHSRQRFLREARALFSLRSEHLVRVLDYGVAQPDTPFIVMEYLEGRTLQVVLREEGPLAYESAAAAIAEAIQGLSVAHAAGLTHRDLKPSNLFAVRTPGGRTAIKVLDFGLATTPAGSDDASITDATTLVGSVAYMSPEHLRSEVLDRRSDIWALGVILYELLTGQKPFFADTSSAVMARILVDPPADFGDRASLWPDGLRDVVLRCMQKEPAARYQSVEELRSALVAIVPESELSLRNIPHNATTREASATEGETTEGSTAPPLRTEDDARPRHRRKLLLTVGGAVSALLVAGAFWSTDRSPAGAAVSAGPMREPGSAVQLVAPAPRSAAATEGAIDVTTVTAPSSSAPAAAGAPRAPAKSRGHAAPSKVDDALERAIETRR